MINIVTYESAHQKGIDKMMNEIAMEFNEQIFPKRTIETPKILDRYWVAINNGEIVGTVGILIVDNDFGVLKKMMLKKEFRGKKLELQKHYSKSLLTGVRKMVFLNFILVP